MAISRREWLNYEKYRFGGYKEIWGCASPSSFPDWIRPPLRAYDRGYLAGLYDTVPYQKKRGYLREQISPDRVELEAASSVELATTV